MGRGGRTAASQAGCHYVSRGAAHARAASLQRRLDANAHAAQRLLRVRFRRAPPAAISMHRATPVKWEYKSIFGDSRVALEEEMNAFGKDGWEFFNITSFGRGSAAFARRPVK